MNIKFWLTLVFKVHHLLSGTSSHRKGKSNDLMAIYSFFHVNGVLWLIYDWGLHVLLVFVLRTHYVTTFH